MIDQADRDLQAWIQSVIPEIDIVLAPPQQMMGKQGVSLYLLALARPSPAWMNRQPTSQIALRYLITTWAANDEEAHHLLGKLIYAVMEKREYELDLTELPTPLWTALGIGPRPSCTLIAPLAFERPEPVSHLVRGPLVIHGAPIRSLHGVVLGPGDIPIAGASVELSALSLSSHTDAHGRFHFSSVPAEPRAMQLLIKARGYTQSVVVEHPLSEKEVLAIHFDSFNAK